MEDLYNMGQTVAAETSYPIIITTQTDGMMLFQAPYFPGKEFSASDMCQGLQMMKEHLQEEKLLSFFPVVPTSPSQISLEPNQMLLQIPV